MRLNLGTHPAGARPLTQGPYCPVLRAQGWGRIVVSGGADAVRAVSGRRSFREPPFMSPMRCGTLRRIPRGSFASGFGCSYSPVGVWALLRHGLGWSWQKSERRALQRDEAPRHLLSGNGTHGRG